MICLLNLLKIVAGHDTVVLRADIVFGNKQTQQCSRIHQLAFIRAVSWSIQNAESLWSHMHLTVEHFSFHVFYKKFGLQLDLMSCSSRLTSQRR